MSIGKPQQPKKSRHDGWTVERQLRFLDVLARTRSITKAAAVAGMSRESAYRLRRRPEAALFAAQWDRAMRPVRPVRPAMPRTPLASHEGHTDNEGHKSVNLAMARSPGFWVTPPLATRSTS